jgi:opacity protein-like surface antigen
MWSEEMDKKIQHVASHEPSYPEQAWDSMEKLLDKHLPQKRKRRRFIFWWFLLPLAGAGLAGAVWIITKSANSHSIKIATTTIPSTQPIKTDIAATKTITNINHEEKAPAAGSSTALSATDPVILSVTAADKQNDKTKKITAIVQAPAIINTSAPGKPVFEKQQNHTTSGTKKLTKKNKRSATTPSTGVSDNNNVQPVLNNHIVQQVNTNATNIVTTKATNNSTITLLAAAEKTVDSLPATDTTAIALTDTTLKQNKKGHDSKWAINISIGPDISAVNLQQPGKVNLQYGVGISYAISSKWTVRTGFYAGRKKYDADSADYTPPADYWNYINNLQKVNANCLVYEIPLSVIYNFSTNKKYSWFASAGIASVLMKEETYEYYYKNTGGQPRSYSRTYKNENDHFFSMLQLSGGYQYQLSPHISLMAEPYLKIPLSGIGVGKVKLNSAGVLFTAGIKPFAKKK